MVHQYKYYVFGLYPSSCLYPKTQSCLFFITQHFRTWILSPSLGKNWAHLSRVYLKTEIESSPLNVVF
jgi:hypothetical protein